MIIMTVTDLDFANNICLLEDNLNSAQELLNLGVSTAASTGLIVNITKTKFCLTIDCQNYHDAGPLDRV
jgi:hypothetical protein